MRNDVFILAAAVLAVFLFPVPALISAASTIMVIAGFAIAGVAIYAAYKSGNNLYNKYLTDNDEKGE